MCRRTLKLILHSAIWSDPAEVFLPRGSVIDPLGTGFLVVGWGVAALSIAGLIRLLRRHEAARFGAPFGFAVLVVLLLLAAALRGEHILIAKSTLVLPAALPVGLTLASGLMGVRGLSKVMLRAALMTLAASGAAFSWYGWWMPAVPAPPEVQFREILFAPRIGATSDAGLGGAAPAAWPLMQ